MRGHPLFVDASAWVALADVSDGFHRRARQFWQAIQDSRRQLLTSDYVLDEVYTLLRRRRNGLEMAETIHDLVVRSTVIETLDVNPEVRQQAWEISTSYRDKVLSFTDCTSFAILRARQLLEVFSFDGDFERVGFIVLPG